jgi:hypothetical protein
MDCLCVFGKTLQAAVAAVGKSLSGVDKTVLQARAAAQQRAAPAHVQQARVYARFCAL